MNNQCFCRTHIHQAVLLISFYGFALSLLNVKALVAIVFNILNFFATHSDSRSFDTDSNSLVNTARRVYFLFAQTTPDSRGLVYVNIFIAGICCLLLAYGNRELRPGYYWPFIALCFYKMICCSSEVLESTMIILHKVPMLRVDHQASTTHFVLFFGASVIVIFFVWAYFMDVTFRARRFMQDELLDQFTQLPRLRNAQLLNEVHTVHVVQPTRNAKFEVFGLINSDFSPLNNIPPPPFDWKPGDPLEQRSATVPAYQP